MKNRLILISVLVIFTLSCSLIGQVIPPPQVTPAPTLITPKTQLFGKDTRIIVNDQFSLLNNSSLILDFLMINFDFTIAEYLYELYESGVKVEVVLTPVFDSDPGTLKVEQSSVTEENGLYTATIGVGEMMKRLEKDSSRGAIEYTLLEINYDVIHVLLETGVLAGVYTDDQAREISTWYINSQHSFTFLLFFTNIHIQGLIL